MTEDKQIEEMTEIMFTEYKTCSGIDCKDCEFFNFTERYGFKYGFCDEKRRATALYNAGYRKAEDVAKEVINDMRKMINGYENIDVYLDRIEKKYSGE